MPSGVGLKDERPPTVHSAMGWCKHGYINHMVKLPHTDFKALWGISVFDVLFLVPPEQESCLEFKLL
jgi:hypothetical protein